jgi:hypothetical protein
MIKEHYMHVGKCHNEIHYFVQLIYANEKIFKKNYPFLVVSHLSRVCVWGEDVVKDEYRRAGTRH